MTIENGNFIVYNYDLPAPIYAVHNLITHRDFKFEDTDINLIASKIFSIQDSVKDANNSINNAIDSIKRLKESIDKKNIDNLPIRFNLVVPRIEY